MTFGLVTESKGQSHYNVVFSNPKTHKETARKMKSTSPVNLRKNIIATGLLEKYPVAVIFTRKGDMVGSVIRNTVNGKFVQYLWQGEGDRIYRCKTDGRVAPVIITSPDTKTVSKAAKPQAIKKTTFGNKFLDEHIIIASVPRFKGKV